MPSKDAAAEEKCRAAEAHSVAAAAAMEEAKPKMTPWDFEGAHTASAMAAGPALKIAHRTMAEEALALLKTALEKGDLEGAATLRATAAQEFELSGSNKVAELSELGKMIADASKKKQSEEAAAAQAIKEEENKPKAKFNVTSTRHLFAVIHFCPSLSLSLSLERFKGNDITTCGENTDGQVTAGGGGRAGAEFGAKRGAL